jgi:acyl-CoA synthetase (AMP-forming)/AMP-acid ligase II
MIFQALSDSTSPATAWAGFPTLYLTHVLAREAEAHPDRLRLINGANISNEQLWQRILKVATWLQRNGVEPKCVVLLALSQDHALSEIIAMAVTHVGGIVSVLPKDISKKRFHGIVNRCEPACVFLDEGTASFKTVIEDILTVWMTPGLSSGSWDEAEIEEILETQAAWGLPFPGKSDDPAFLVFDDSDDVQGRTWSHNSLNSVML